MLTKSYRTHEALKELETIRSETATNLTNVIVAILEAKRQDKPAFVAQFEKDRAQLEHRIKVLDFVLEHLM